MTNKEILMNELNYTTTGYQVYREELRQELEKTSEGFVRIGYLLKVARDTDILKDSGFKDYLDFAQLEYGLDKSTVSRFININTRFSEGGNSDRLIEQYKGFGYAKLAVMLTIPEVIAEELTPDYTKAEISEIKEQIDEEKAKTDIEHFVEEQDAILNPPEENIVDQTIKAIGKEYPQIYLSIFEKYDELVPDKDYRVLKDIFMPFSPTTYATRVPGKGKVILIVKEEGASITEVRTEQKTMVPWNVILTGWIKAIPDRTTDQTARGSWQQAYGEALEEPEETKPEKEQPKQVEPFKPYVKTEKKQQAPKGKVAPVQPKKVNVPEKKKPQKEKMETLPPKNDENEQKIGKKTPEIENATPHESECGFEGGFKPDFEPLKIAETLENTAKLIRNGDFTHAHGLLEDALKALTHILEKKQEDN